MDMLSKYKMVADRYKKIMLTDQIVEGIAYLGGLARGFADEFQTSILLCSLLSHCLT
jgi:hypothetical protein